MFVTIITDCSDANAAGRQQTRAAALFGITPTFVPLPSTLSSSDEIQAAGMLIDCLDASRGAAGVILVNAAPRSGAGKQWPNGTPFGYFYVGKTLVVSTVAGLTLSLVKKLGLTEEIHVINIEATTREAAADGRLSEEDAARMLTTQFRSYDFLPRAALWLTQGHMLTTTALLIHDIPDMPSSVWWADSFGNCKTTLLTDELSAAVGESITTEYGPLTRFQYLKDVPDNTGALITGSSGLGKRRFAEIVVQGKSAAQHFRIAIGSPITLTR